MLVKRSGLNFLFLLICYFKIIPYYLPSTSNLGDKSKHSTGSKVGRIAAPILSTRDPCHQLFLRRPLLEIHIKPGIRSSIHYLFWNLDLTVSLSFRIWLGLFQMDTSAEADERLRSRKPIPTPVPAYLPSAGSPLAVSHGLYQSIQQAPRVLVEEFVLPIRSGRAWTAPAGSIVRISTPEGPQVGK